MSLYRRVFARRPTARVWRALGLSCLATWGPWAAAVGWEVASHVIPAGYELRWGEWLKMVAAGPAVAGYLAAHLLLGLERNGWAIWGVGVSSAAASLAALAAAGVWLPRARWAVWAAGAGCQGVAAWTLLQLLKA